FNLAAGDYIIAVGIVELQCYDGCYASQMMSIEEAVNGVMTSSYSWELPYTMPVSSEAYAADVTWRLPGSGAGVVGRHVSLDADETAAPLYLVIDNTQETLVVESTDDLSDVVGNELIGVHVFETLDIRNGASVDFGDDRVIINDLAGSELNDAELIASDLDMETVKHFLTNSGGTLVLTNGVQLTDDLAMPGSSLVVDSFDLTGNLTLSGGALEVNSLNLTGNLTLSSGSRISVAGPDGVSVGGTIAIGGTGTVMDTRSLSAANLLLDGAELTASSITIANDITLFNSSSVMPPAADAGNKLLFPLDVTAGGVVTIDETSALNADGKGYPSDYYTTPDFVQSSANAGCHGGLRSDDSDDCAHGRFEFADDAGNAGKYSSATNTGNGGGIIKLRAQSLLLDGAMSARGIAGQQGGAGGSLDVSVDVLEGNGSLDVAGGNAISSSSTYRSGGGGRIVIAATDDSNFSENGSLVIRGGSYAGTDHVAGSGTAYRKLANETFGHLYIDNGNATAPQGSTPIRTIGRHTIQSVESLGDGQWRISVGEARWFEIDISDYIQSGRTYSGGTYIDHHNFTVTTASSVTISADSSGNFTPHLYLFRNDGTRTEDDYIVDGLNSVTYDLAPGSYQVAIGSATVSLTEAVEDWRSRLNRQGGSYSMRITGDRAWVPTAESTTGGLSGRLVSFDATDAASPYYPVIYNESDALVVETTDDLSGIVGQELIGVQIFETLNVIDGASADFGGDRVLVRDLTGSSNNGGGLSAGEMDMTQFEALLSTGGMIELSMNLPQADSLTLTAGQAILDSLSVTGALTIGGGAEVTVNGALTIGDTLTVADSATQLDATSITAGEVLLDAGTVVSQQVASDSDITLRNSATLSVPDATTDPKQVFGLKVSAVNHILLEDIDSAIDVSGKGYPAGHYTGPGFWVDSDASGCHAGGRSDDLSSPFCIYGRYQRARFAGSGGNQYSTTYNGRGGGLVEISATSLTLNGAIRADGIGGTTGGAGGSIHIEAAQLAGTGTMSVMGGNARRTYTSYRSGGGGRISILAPDSSGFVGTYSLAGGNSSSTTHVA
ncbi:MAG: hypothetical protein PVF13_09230, partial [Chromatiales bacterium]